MARTQTVRKIDNLLRDLYQNDKKYAFVSHACRAHKISTNIGGVLFDKGIIEKESGYGKIVWATKEPNWDMAICVGREYTKRRRRHQSAYLERKSDKDHKALDHVKEIQVNAQQVRADSKRPFKGWMVNILGYKFLVRKPVLSIKKQYEPF